MSGQWHIGNRGRELALRKKQLNQQISAYAMQQIRAHIRRHVILKYSGAPPAADGPSIKEPISVEVMKNKINFFEVPIIINNRDRLTTLRNMINSLQNMGYKNLLVIDNESTYPPLLSYYKNDCPAKIFYEKNLGHRAICESKCLDTINSQYIIYTDSDLEFGDNYPEDFVEVFIKLYKKYNAIDNNRYMKVGTALRIDDLPDKYPKKKHVLEWEKQFWKNRISDELEIYNSPIDTTLALYARNDVHSSKFGNLSAIRVGGKYTVRHKDWYYETLPDDVEYYTKHKTTPTHWS